MTRQGWVYFCGPGVISDEGETFAQMPGFACVPSVAAMLPEGRHAVDRRAVPRRRHLGQSAHVQAGGRDAL